MSRKLTIKDVVRIAPMYMSQVLNCGVINLSVVEIVRLIIYDAEFHLVAFGSPRLSTAPRLFLLHRFLPAIVWFLSFHLAKLILISLPHSRG